MRVNVRGGSGAFTERFRELKLYSTEKFDEVYVGTLIIFFFAKVFIST